MSEQNGIIEIDLKGISQSKLGEFESMEEAALSKLIKNILYILQDTTMIKSKASSLGALQMIAIKGTNCRYEVAVGSSTIKIIKYS